MVATHKNCTLNILLADDGSKHSQAAVALLGDLPLAENSHILALRVFTPAKTGEIWLLEEALKLTRTTLEQQGKQVETELVLGHPAEKIVEVANQRNADLIIMGAKGLRATLGIFLGGVAQQVVEYATRPVLVVRAPYSGLKHVLLVIDGSAQSQQTIACVSQFPLPQGAKVQVLHVMPPMLTGEDIVRSWPASIDVPIYVPSVEVEEQLRQQAQAEERQGKEMLSQAVETLRAANIEAESVLLRGDAATKIIQYAKDNHVDLIVSGGRGMSRIKSWLLGSVSRKLLHYAPCSVMVVKSEAKAKQDA